MFQEPSLGEGEGEDENEDEGKDGDLFRMYAPLTLAEIVYLSSDTICEGGAWRAACMAAMDGLVALPQRHRV